MGNSTEGMRLLLAPADDRDTQRLKDWLERQGQEISVRVPEGTMGGGETLSATILGLAGLKAFAEIAKEWVKAHRTSISLTIEGRGSFTVEGSTDVDHLIQVLCEEAADGDGDA